MTETHSLPQPSNWPVPGTRIDRSHAKPSPKSAQEYLRRGCGLVVVDVVTTCRADLRADLLTALGVATDPEAPMSFSATSYHPVVSAGDGKLFAWPFPLEINRPLPTVPLWLGPELAVPLDLEASYMATCVDLRIPHAG